MPTLKIAPGPGRRPTSSTTISEAAAAHLSILKPGETYSFVDFRGTRYTAIGHPDGKPRVQPNRKPR